MRFGDEGLVLGLGTVLSRAAATSREVPVDVSDNRLVTLLAAAHLRVAPRAGLVHLRKAAERWRQHDNALASMHLALSGLNRLDRPVVDARRLFFADHLLSVGFRPDDIVKALGDIAKYSADQPRVPAGSGRTSGQWTGGGAPSDQQSSDADSQRDQQSSEGRNSSKFKIELPSSFVCAPPKGPTTPMSEAAKKLADAIEVTESIAKWRELGPREKPL